MDIFLTNNLTNKKEQFVPKNKDHVGMYVCGPTVYDDPHIGNARPLIIFDVLFRLLKKNFKRVTYVRNITDIDDKIIQSSKDQKISTKDLTEKITKSFFEDCKFLNCENPSFQPKATEHIALMIEMINQLIEKGFAYENKSHVYFEVKKFSDYGKLSNKKLEDLIAGSRVEISENKKNSEDFVLWKPSSEDEPAWDSPWGKGRPGWHLECSAMSKKYLGKEFDVHGGGIDLIFPHHENEIAQSCSNNNTKNFANYWVHNGFVTINKEKMSKSLGNIITISEAVKKYSGQAVRLALLSAHYSQPLDWNDELLKNQKGILDKWYNLYSEEKVESKEVDEVLLDDLNTPGFIARIHELYNEANKGNDEKKLKFNQACRLIGLFNISKTEWETSKKKKISVSESYIIKKINERTEAKNKGNFFLADKIREELSSKGILIEDQKGKTTWKIK